MNDDVLKLYNSLQKYGYNNLGTSEEFGAKVQDSTSRRKLYDSLTRDGFGNLGTFEEFSGRLVKNGDTASEETATATAAKPAQETPAQTEQKTAETPAPADNSKWAVPQSFDWKAQAEEMRRSVMPGEPVSMPEKKAEDTPSKAEPEGNPFPYRGELENELNELRDRYAKASEQNAENVRLIEEYDRRMKEFHDSLDPTSKKTRENEKWLREHKSAYMAAKDSDEMKEYARAKAEYEETARAMGNAREKIAERKNREEMASPAEVIATGKTVFGGDNAGRSDSEYKYRKLADELYKSAGKEYDWSSKNDEGYNGGFMDKLWTATKQFVADAGNNIDSGSLTFGLSKGLAEKEAREVGDKYNGIITDVLKDMKMSDGDIKAVLSSIAVNGEKLQAMNDELKTEGAEIDTMMSTYDDMVRRGDPDARSYGEALQKRIDAYNKRINEEYKPLSETYDRDREAYETVMSAIDSAVESGLTGGEKALLDAMEKFTEAKTLSEPVRSTASKAGAGAEQSAEFMLDFILTGGISKAGTKAATKLATNRALKKYGADFLKDLASVGKSVKPGLGLRLGTDVVTSLARTGVMFPRTIQAYGENAIEYSGKDYAGRIDFDRTQANALGNALLTQFIEYWSEGFGEYFGEAEQALFRNVTKSAPVETIGKTLRGYRGSIGQYLDKGKFDGMFNEMLEEVVGSSFNALAGWMSGDRVGDAGAMKEFFAGENLATLALSFLPMSAIGAATNIKAYHKMKERYDAGVQALNPFIESGAVSRKELEQLSKDIPNMTPNQIKDKVVDIADRARKSNGGKLPEDFAKNLLGYVEGEFAMGLRYDEWEESREKMSVVNSYASNYANPDPRSAWDLNDAEQTAKKAALDAGFSEEELDDNDSYILAQEAFELKGTEPERADILMNYANAKASVDGLRNGYKEQGDQIAAANEEFVRSNLDVNGKVIMAVVNENGVQKPAFILSEDAEVAPDGTVSTPTGNGVVKYVANRNGRFEKESTIISGNVSMAREVGTDEYVADQTASLQQRRAEIFDAAQKAVSPTGQARAIYQRLGHTVIVDDHNGVYEPFMVESMTDDGTEVVISGDKKALQGVARSIGLEIPPSKYLKAPIAKLYPVLAKNADGSLSTGLGEKQEQNETEATPATESVEQNAQAETAAEQTQDVADLRDKNVTISDKGVLKTAHVLSTDEGRVVYEELDGNGDVVRTTFLPADAFTRAMQEAETPAPAPAQEVVEETPAEEATAQEEETELPEETAPFIPVDEKTGEKIYDAPGVEVSDAIEDLYKTDGLSEEDVDMYIADRASKAEAARNPERGDMSPAAWGQAKKEAARVADFWNAMKQAAEARKKQTSEQKEEEKKKEDAAAIGTPGQPEGGAGAVTPDLPASEDKDTDNSEKSNTSAERNSIERKLARRLKRWEKRTGIKVHVRNSIDEVTDQAAKEGLREGRLLTGWFIPETGEVEIYMPNISSEAELDRSFIHEVVSHKGLRELLGEEGYNALCDRVWDELMTDGDKEYYTGYNRHLDAVGEAQRRAAADEYIARLSENLDFYDNRSIFQKLVDWIKRILGEELSVGELEYDAKERAAGATASMTDDVLRVILSDSMKRYVETTRRGQQDAGAKREIGSEVGGAMDTDASGNKKGQTRFSMKSIVNGGGLEVLEDDGSGNVAFVTTDGRKFNAKHPITARDLMGLENTVMFHMMKDARDISHLDPQKEMRIWQAYADQLNAFLQKGVAKDGLSGADRLKALWQWEVENSVYRSVAPNSDEQYKYSLDITRVCKKNEATIRAISAMQRKLGAGLTPGQVMDVYMAGIEEGYQVPCPVCYVFSRYINNGIVATIAINGQKTWGADLVDPSTLSEEEKRERIAMWKARLDEQEAFNAQNKKQIEQAKKDCASIIEEIDELSYQISSGKLKGKERTAAEKRVKLLDNRYRAAFDLVSQSALTQWIKQFAIRQTKNGYAPTADGKAYELWEDTFHGFPEEYALDLRLTAETIEKYPAIQRLRKARGAAGGKEIHFASNNDVGDIPMMLGADNSVNFYQKAVNARTEKERKYFLGKATERFKNAHKYAQQQSLRGGQRMWSWSDNIERLAPDVFVNLLQLQMLGGALQSYSKQLEGVNLVANLQGYVNGSLMGYGKGWTELKPDDVKVVDGKEVLANDIKDTVTEKRDGQEVKRERYLAKEGSPVITVDGKKVTLLFDDVVGIDPYGRDVDGKHLKGLFDLNGELDKAGNILVGMNDTHIIAAMADDRVFFIIPWHASGNSIHQVQQMLNGLGVKTMVKDYMDYTKVQEEKDMDKKKKSAEEADFVDEDVDVSKEEKIEEADPIRQEIIDFWESHKNESDRVEKGLPPIPSGENGKLSKAQKRYRKLRDAIFDGLFDELPKEDQDEITSDIFLSQVLRKVNKVVDDKEMTAGDKKFIYPYEYWNEQSTYDTADENGARYLEYCRRLGYKPKFVGKLDSKAKTDFGNFADYKGYWKLLIDRRMYDVNRRFQDLDPVTTDNYDPRTVDPEWTAENFPLTAVADDPGAERIADRAIEKEGRTFKDGVPTANYGGDIQSAVKKYEMVSKLVDLKPKKSKKKSATMFRDASGEHDVNSDPQVSEGGVTMFRERTAPAPQKTQKVYKLMRLDNGNLYPLFIDRDAEPIKLGTWYDADSPDMEFLKKMPSGVFLVDAQNGTYTSLEDYKKERGEKVNTLPSKSDVEEAAKNGLRWMKISDTERAQRRYGGENRKYENIGINGSEGVSTFAMRPGWHAGSLPTMRQIGKGAEKNLRDDKFVWVEGEISADKDYNEEAQGNPDKDIPTHIPADGFYMKATNANKKASQADRVGWYVAGAFKPNRIMSDAEARQVIDAWNAEHQDAPVEYDWPRESGKVFNAETMSLEDENPEPNGPNGGGTRFREVASDLYDRYENQNGDDKPWMSEGELIDRIEEELPYGLETKELFAKIDEYRRLDEEDFNEGRRDFSGSERDNVFQEILSSLKKLSEGESAGTRFREAAPVFFSNAAQALGRIKMDKATPEQWLKMLEKEGGLKSGEDKWIGLSDWLKSSDRKSLTRQEVADYIAQNEIQVEEQRYANGDGLEGQVDEKYPGFSTAFGIDNSYESGDIWVKDIDKARELYERVTGEDADDVYEYELEEFAINLANEARTSRAINGTRLHYTTDGLENKREIALTVPTIEPWNQGDDIHFGDAGNGRAVAWIRFGETTTSDEAVDAAKEYHDFYSTMQEKYGMGWERKMTAAEKKRAVEVNARVNDSSGWNRVLVIDEIQSKRHQEGREKGYKTDKPVWTYDPNVPIPERERYSARKVGANWFVYKDGEIEATIAANSEDEAIAKFVQTGAMYEHEIDKRIPTAPFEKNWHELAMKRMLRLAAEEGYDYVAWTTGTQQADRYNMESAIGKLYASKDGEKYYVEVYDPNGNEITFNGLVGDSRSSGTYTPEELVKNFGKEAAKEIIASADALPSEEEAEKLREKYNASGTKEDRDAWRKASFAEIDGSELFKGEGMKGFYDDILPRFMNKYGKKWGVKVQDIELPYVEEAGRVMHAVPVTPEMKESVMQGQTMFREKVTPEQDQEYMDAVNSGDMEKAGQMVRDAFKAAFPDTKVVDENGDPLVVYRVERWEGDTADYTVFDENKGGNWRGFYFTNRDAALKNYGDESTLRAFFLDSKNPFTENNFNILQGDKQELIDMGYDGMIFAPDGIDARNFEVKVFEPTQIKSADPVTYDDNGNVIPLSERFNPENNDIRFREVTTGNAQLDYENEIRSKLTQFLVEWQDGDIPVRIAMNKIMNEVGLEHISDDMDYLTRHNLASSIADAQMHQYKLFYYEPMMKTVSEIVDKLLGRRYNIVEKLTGQKRAKQDEIYNELVDFCYAMSGLERNAWKRAEAAEKMAKELERLSDKWEKESEDINADSRLSEDERSRALTRAENRYLKMREEIEAKYAPRDYSGITDLMGRPKEEWQEAEADAQNMVDAFRDRLGDDGMIDELWDRIHACTDFNLEHAYKYGLLTRTEYERLHGTESQPRLWQYYMPLRGFSERTAEDEYAYSMFTNDLAGGYVVKEAKGRTTKADDPFATMRHISELELIQGLNNWAKQALYNFVLTAGENTLLTQVEPWYVKEAGTDNWIAAEPNEGESLEEFENRMQEARSNGEARKGRNGLKLGLILGNKMHRNQHMIRLKVNGQEKMIWVNGSPLLAQVVNGVHGWDNKVVNKIRGLNRSLSQFYTTYSAKFLTKNKMRDTQFSRIAALVDESQPYLRQLEKNWWANNGYGVASYPMILLVAEWNSGKLEKKENRTEREQMFIDFMYDGGATGYTMRNTMDQIKRELEKMVKNAGRGERNIPIIDWYAKGIGALNEASELLTRFTFYQTSRMMGRSRQRAAYDAKESSVNFNRRGLRSGVGVSGFTSALASVLYLFMNPAIQGLDKFVRLHKSHPWSMGLVDATYFMMGFVNSLLNAMVAGFSDGGDGDDDEKKMGPDWYWNIPEWVRRSNMIIGSPFKKLGKWGYLVIALPIEYKGFYAMGELASAIVQGKYAAKDTPTIANEVVGVVSELMPINPVEGYTPGNNVAMSVVRNLMPDFAAPIMDVATNRSFAGIPLWKENIYDETEPLSQSAFASTPEILNKVVIKLAEATADKPWHVDIPSGALRGVLKGYGGGAYNFVEDLGKFVFADAAHPRRYENFPFVSGFSGYLEEDRRDSFNSDALQRYKELSKDVVKRIRSAAPGEDITEAMVYNHPEDLPKEAKVQTILHADEWLLGKMYFDGIKQKSGQKESKVNKRGDVYTVDVKDDIGALRKAWKNAKDEYIAIAEDKNSTQEQKDAALENVQKAWVKFTDSEDALVDRLLEEEYYHVKQKIDNGIPYEPKETLGEKAYKLTNRK